MSQPKTLQQAIKHFADPDNCIAFMVERRWPNGVTCPTCGRADVRFISTRRMWECKEKHPKRQFSVKVGTIMEDSAIPLDKWLIAMWMLANCKNGISSYEIARALGITQKSAWFMLHRIRLAMHKEDLGQIGGRGKEVEVDQAFIGGAARFMHGDKRRRRITETGSKDKTPIMGMLERGGEIRASVIPNCRKPILTAEIRRHIKAHSAIYTDALYAYNMLKHQNFEHQVVDHAERYVDGKVHTNGLENFWSLLKRQLKGTYISVEEFHLFRYLDEQVLRYNLRELAHDGLRFQHVASNVIGKRLTYAEVTGKTTTTPN